MNIFKLHKIRFITLILILFILIFSLRFAFCNTPELVKCKSAVSNISNVTVGNVTDQSFDVLWKTNSIENILSNRIYYSIDGTDPNIESPYFENTSNLNTIHFTTINLGISSSNTTVKFFIKVTAHDNTEIIDKNNGLFYLVSMGKGYTSAPPSPNSFILNLTNSSNDSFFVCRIKEFRTILGHELTFKTYNFIGRTSSNRVSFNQLVNRWEINDLDGKGSFISNSEYQNFKIIDCIYFSDEYQASLSDEFELAINNSGFYATDIIIPEAVLNLKIENVISGNISDSFFSVLWQTNEKTINNCVYYTIDGSLPDETSNCVFEEFNSNNKIHFVNIYLGQSLPVSDIKFFVKSESTLLQGRTLKEDNQGSCFSIKTGKAYSGAPPSPTSLILDFDSVDDNLFFSAKIKLEKSFLGNIVTFESYNYIGSIKDNKAILSDLTNRWELNAIDGFGSIINGSCFNEISITDIIIYDNSGIRNSNEEKYNTFLNPAGFPKCHIDISPYLIDYSKIPQILDFEIINVQAKYFQLFWRADCPLSDINLVCSFDNFETSYKCTNNLQIGDFQYISDFSFDSELPNLIEFQIRATNENYDYHVVKRNFEHSLGTPVKDVSQIVDIRFTNPFPVETPLKAFVSLVDRENQLSESFFYFNEINDNRLVFDLNDSHWKNENRTLYANDTRGFYIKKIFITDGTTIWKCNYTGASDFLQNDGPTNFVILQDCINYFNYIYYDYIEKFRSLTCDYIEVNTTSDLKLNFPKTLQENYADATSPFFITLSRLTLKDIKINITTSENNRIVCPDYFIIPAYSCGKIKVPFHIINDDMINASVKETINIKFFSDEFGEISSNIDIYDDDGCPSCPQNLKYIPSDKTITVFWEAPITSGKDNINEYRISWHDRFSGNVWPTPSTIVSAYSEKKCIINNLSNGVEYKIYVNAVNDYGVSETTYLYWIKPCNVPDKINSLSLDSKENRIDLTWAAPTCNGGDEILGYNIYRSILINDPSPVLIENINGYYSYAYNFYDNDIIPKTTYYYQITAVNKAGESLPTEISGFSYDCPNIRNLTINEVIPQISTKALEELKIKGNCRISWEAYDSDSSFEIKLYYSTQLFETPGMTEISTLAYPINIIPITDSNMANTFKENYFDWDTNNFVKSYPSIIVPGTDYSSPLYIYAVVFDNERTPSNANGQIIICNKSLIIEKANEIDSELTFSFEFIEELLISADNSLSIPYSLFSQKTTTDKVNIIFKYSNINDPEIEYTCISNEGINHTYVIPSDDIKQFLWDTTELSDGEYSLSACIYDGINIPDYVKSDKTVKIKHILSEDQTMPDVSWVSPSLNYPINNATGIIGVTLEVEDNENDPLSVSLLYNKLPVEDFDIQEFSDSITLNESKEKHILTFKLDTSNLSEGPYFLLAKVKQTNQNLPSVRAWSKIPVYVRKKVQISNLRITNMKVDESNNSMAQLSLSLITDIESLVLVEYGTDITTEKKINNNQIATAHLINIPDISPDNLYYYKITVITKDNNQVVLDNDGEFYTFIIPKQILDFNNLETQPKFIKGKIKDKPNSLVHVYLEKNISSLKSDDFKSIEMLSTNSDTVSQAITAITDSNGEWQVDLSNAITESGEPLSISEQDFINVEMLDKDGNIAFVENVSLENIENAITTNTAIAPLSLGAAGDGVILGETIEFNLQLDKGFNLVATPMELYPKLTAESLLKITENAIGIYHFSSESSAYKSLIKFSGDESGIIGENFDIDSVNGFFIKMEKEGLLTLQGKKILNSRPVSFLKGFNMVSIPYNPDFPANTKTRYNSLSLIKKIGKEAIGIYKFANGQYKNLIRINDSGDESKDYIGDVFDINQGEAYFIKTTKNIGLIP